MAKKKINPKFDLEKQYQLFLSRLGISEDKMHPQQKTQIKQTFFGACGQMFILMRDDVGGLEKEEEAVEVMQDMLNQVGDFFQLEKNQGN